MLKILKKVLSLFLLLPIAFALTACTKQEDPIVSGVHVTNPESVFYLGQDFEFKAEKVQKEVNGAWVDISADEYTVNSSDYNKNIEGIYSINVYAYEHLCTYFALVIKEERLTIEYGTVLNDVYMGVDHLKIKVDSQDEIADEVGQFNAVLKYRPVVFYTAVEYYVRINVVKANPVVPEIGELNGTYGQALSSITLPQGFAWEDSTIVMNQDGVQTFKATYTPTDTEHYNVVENIDVNVHVYRV